MRRINGDFAAFSSACDKSINRTRRWIGFGVFVNFLLITVFLGLFGWGTYAFVSKVRADGLKGVVTIIWNGVE